MKYYNLYIDFEPSWDIYNKVTDILGLEPERHKKGKFDESNIPDTWHYQIIADEEKDEYPDFINIFMDILEPNFDKLEELGIYKNNILIWMNYIYKHQCSLGFNPDELERLGKHGIALNIDCFENKEL